jgi:hypothetical protein
MPDKVTNYFGRPYKVIHGDRFAAAIKKIIRSREVKAIKTDVGSVDQFTDSTNVVENRQLCERLKIVYD